MREALNMARGSSSNASSELSFTPELQRSQSVLEDSDADGDSIYPTPSDSTAALELYPASNTKLPDDHELRSIDIEEEARRIHYIDTLFDVDCVTEPVSMHPASSSSNSAPVTLASSISPLLSSAPAYTTSTSPSSHQTLAQKRGCLRKPSLSQNKKARMTPNEVARSVEVSIDPERKSPSLAPPSSLLSFPDLDHLIPQNSNSGAAQQFIKNNVEVFDDLFVALQKHASKNPATTSNADAQLASSIRSSPATLKKFALGHKADTVQVPAPVECAELVRALPTSASDPVSTHQSLACIQSKKVVPTPGDDLRAEVKKRMAEVAIGHDGLREELVKMNVDMRFYENAHKTVDERISVLRERIAKRITTLQQQDAEKNGRSNKTRKATGRNGKEAEMRKHRLDKVALSLEQDRATEDEANNEIDALDAFEFDDVLEDPSEASASVLSTNDIEKGIGMNDEELAKVLGISTHDLAGFSTSLDLPSDPKAHPEPVTTSVHQSFNAVDNLGHLASTADEFDVAAFLDMASAVPALD